MIRMTHSDLKGVIEWDENHHLGELIIESPTLFREICRDLNEETDDGVGISFSSGDKLLSFSSELDAIFNPTKLNFNSRKAVATLLKMLVKTSNSEDFYLSTNKFKTKIVKYLNELADTENFGFEVVADDFNLDQIAKAVNFHVVGDEDDFIELLTDYLEVMTDLGGIKLTIFVNLRSYLSDSELEHFIKNVLNHQFDVLLIENQVRAKYDEFQRIIVDADFCEI